MFACLAQLCFDSSRLAADNIVESLSVSTSDRGIIAGDLDWTEGALTVFGEAAAPDELVNPVRRRLAGFRAAKVIAYRNLAEIIGEVHVDARTKVSMAVVTDDEVRTKVEQYVRGARVVHGSRQERDGLFRLALQLDLRGRFANAVLPDSTAARLLPPGEIPESDSLLVFVPPQPYTGVIVDARGTGLKPNLSPRIIDDSGRVIYSAEHVQRDYAVNVGVVGYDSDMPRAANSERLGAEAARPYVVSAVGVAGLYGGDAVVSRDSGTRILMADMDGDFLAECRVVFVVGPQPARDEIVWLDSTRVAAAVDTNYLETRADSARAVTALADSVPDSTPVQREDAFIHQVLGTRPPRPPAEDTTSWADDYEELFGETDGGGGE